MLTKTEKVLKEKNLSLTLQIKELNRVNLNLHKKIAKLEAQNISLTNKLKLGKPTLDLDLMHDQLKKVFAQIDEPTAQR
ncbi:MAG TPA: hypothetical protein VK742_05745 [Candidatus Sulfotelmatobacter sp.]|jgi:hypothetical protein|nr:hypothetical protein [Candidatus Sulfotelmatobacter sp.]